MKSRGRFGRKTGWGSLNTIVILRNDVEGRVGKEMVMEGRGKLNTVVVLPVRSYGRLK